MGEAGSDSTNLRTGVNTSSILENGATVPSTVLLDFPTQLSGIVAVVAVRQYDGCAAGGKKNRCCRSETARSSYDQSTPITKFTGRHERSCVLHIGRQWNRQAHEGNQASRNPCSLCFR